MQRFYLDNNEYLLTDSEADIVDAKDEEFPPTREGNIAFNKFFREFLKKHHIRPVNQRMSRYWTGEKNTENDSVKLAVTQRAMQSIVDVVDPSHSLTLTFDQEATTSAWADGKVLLPVTPIAKSDTLHDAINLEGGFAIHEACHSKRTRELLNTEFRQFIKDPINMTISNMIEDVRIEAEEMKENPGFRGYLDGTKEWLWKDGGEGSHLPATWPEKSGDKLQAAISGVNYAEYSADKIATTDYADKIATLRSMVDAYCEERRPDPIKTVTKMRSIMDIQDDEPLEYDNEGAGGDGVPEGPKLPCAFTHGDEELSVSTKNEVKDLVEQEVESLDPADGSFMPDKVDKPESITVYHKPLAAGIKAPRVDDMINKAKAALTLRKAAPRADERHMLSGELDEDELYRLYVDDMRVFRDITEEVIPSAAVYLLVDLSGSMCRSGFGGSLLSTATRLSYLFVTALRNNPNVTLKVLAHTGDNEARRSATGLGSASFYRVWEQGESLNRIGLLDKGIRAGENYDSFAIAWAGKMLAQESADQKLLICLSDGIPAGRFYGGGRAITHVRKHVDALEKKGIDVVQVAIDPSLDEFNQKQMFKHYVAMQGYGSEKEAYSVMIRNLQRILEKVAQQ